MPKGFTAKDERQVLAIKKSCLARGGKKKDCDRIAFATVNKRRRAEGRTALAPLKGIDLDAWIHTGGGCFVGGGKQFPCDDDFENEETGEVVNFQTTKDRHFNMPERVEVLEEILVLNGVGRKRTVQEAFNGLEQPSPLLMFAFSTPGIILIAAGLGVAAVILRQADLIGLD